MHAHNFKIKKIIVLKLSIEIQKSDYTIVFVSIKTSKQDLTPLYFNAIFWEKIVLAYSNFLMIFEKLLYEFT